MFISPHSLGTLIEWKHDFTFGCGHKAHIPGPHSLGTLIEWKHQPLLLRLPLSLLCPHSLGTLIEWKHIKHRPDHTTINSVPTRWGH